LPRGQKAGEEQNETQKFENRAEVLMYNQCGGDKKELIQQFNEVRQLNFKLSKPVMHITLSMAPGEKLAKAQLMELVKDCSRELGFQDNQFVAIAHRDTNHQHLHIVANRVGFDKRTVSDRNNYQKIANYCRKTEMKYDMKRVLNPRRYLPKQYRAIPRIDHRKELLKSHIRQSLRACSTFQLFELRMKAAGYKIIKGRGISFADEKKVQVKGSDVGFSLQTIERILEKQRMFYLNPGAAGNQSKLQEIQRQDPELKRDPSDKNIDLLHDLLKSEKNEQGINPHFHEKRRRRKEHRSRHL
jgi:hypothetical protein